LDGSCDRKKFTFIKNRSSFFLLMSVFFKK